MKHSLIRLALVAASAFALAACDSAPTKPEPAQAVATGAPAYAPAAPGKSLVEMEYELRKLEIEGKTKREQTRMMTLVKFADESKSEFAKGVVAGLLGQPQAESEPARQSLLQAQANAERRAAQERRDKAQLELAKAQLDSQNSGWNKFLQVWDRGVDLAKFKLGLGWQKTQTVMANEQERYRMDTVRGAQSDGFSLGSGAALDGVQVGSGATLGGVSAGAAAASAGASAVANAQTPAPATDTPAE
ncbi:hypothetical protein ACVC7V_21520 [Hydrogenophaga sp. A37]|uniref:hypothetical protein n=1 Tax=Hydrogenophaga sp. A37 TaxID=1945864 RepID=UPI0009877E2C|nr:hypothetical protein [Hydrogenophaga sp. A37]OOG84249.1 hypothetical protein B0E41_10900 [Hydrogenophaga sp. A37]